MDHLEDLTQVLGESTVHLGIIRLENWSQKPAERLAKVCKGIEKG